MVGGVTTFLGLFDRIFVLPFLFFSFLFFSFLSFPLVLARIQSYMEFFNLLIRILLQLIRLR